MTATQEGLCSKIIHGAALAAGTAGAGLAQLPCSDSVVIVPIQIGMIISLGEVFDINITEVTAKAILKTALATMSGRAISQVLVGWIPGIGNIANASTAVALTEGIGWYAANDFDRN